MPIIHQIPISISALNDNVDTDLNLVLRRLTVSNIILRNPNINIQSDVDNGTISLFGGTGIYYGGLPATDGYIFLYGKTHAAYPSEIHFYTVNADAAGIPIRVMRVVPNGNDSYVSLEQRKIKNLGLCVDNTDAANKNYVDGKFPAWQGWTPTLTWSGATPASLTTVARWTPIGKTVYFSFYTTSNDSNGCTGLTFTLPSTNISAASAFVGYEIYGVAGVTYGSLITYGTATNCSFRDFKAATDGQRIAVIVEGFYEVA